MKAMILAAGRGQRMMPLTSNTPKPMLRISGKPLLQHHIEKLRDSGVSEIVINHCYLGQQLVDYFADGSQFGVNIQWSAESSALETAGGIRKALHLLDDAPFIAVNSDIWTDLAFDKIINSPHIKQLELGQTLAHLVLVKNPTQNLAGDFALVNDKVCNQASTMWTYSGVAIYHPEIVKACILDQPQGLTPLLRAAANKGLVTGEVYSGNWQDIGTPERLTQIQSKYSSIELRSD